MNLLTRLFSIVALLVLAACGGGSGGGSPFGGDAGSGGGNGGGSGSGTSRVADLAVTLSSTTIPNTGSTTITATVTALDSSRVAVSNATVSLAADNGGVVTVTGTSGLVTDATGTVVATVGIGSDHSNRDITVSASANGMTRSAVLKVVNSATGASPTSIEVLADATSAGTGGGTVAITAFVKDANNNALPNTAVSFAASTGTLSSVSTTTDASGAATAVFSAGADKTNRTAVITVTSGTVSKQLTLPITGTKLTLSGPTSLTTGTTTTFDVAATDSKGNAISGLAITASSSLGNPLTATGGASTNSSGVVSYRYTGTNAGTDALVFSGANATVSPSPALVVSGQQFSFVSPAASTTVPVNTAQTVTVQLTGNTGGTTVNFAATGGTLSASSATTNAQGQASVSLTSASAGPVTVQATVANSTTTTTLPLVIVATTPAKLVLQVTPTAVAPNTSSATSNQAQVVAKVTDANANPVQGVTVNFTRVTDPSGGNLLQASATTDANGQASVAYRSGAESTASNGVVLRATVASTSSVTGTATLTVNQAALFIALGTGNTITNLDEQTYKKDWVVYVTDANGIAVDGVTLTIKAIPTQYLTGRLAWNGTVWAYASPIWSCRNEDANTNGILDAGEDDNGDGVLWPGNVIGVSPGTTQTTNGRATISLTYAESYAPWVQLKLTASATVAGTESKTEVEFIVSGFAGDFSVETVTPAGVVSPFGLLPKGSGAFCTKVQ